MNSKQTMMLIISIVLCLAIYPLYDIAIAIMIMTAATVAALTVMGNKPIGLIPVLLSLAGALVFGVVFGAEYMIPGILTAIAALAGFVMGISIKSKWALQGVLLFGGGVYLLAVMAAIFGINRYYDIDSINMLMNSIKEMAYNSLVPYMGVLIEGTGEQLREMINTTYNYVTTLIPSLLIIVCAAMAYISFGIARYILKKNKIILPLLPDRRHLIMSRGSGWIMILVWLLSLVSTNDRIGYALTNISIIISAFFFVCGISLALFLIEYKVKKKGLKWVLRVLMFMAILSPGSMFVSELFVMAAIIDSVWNFRKIGYILHQ